MAVYLVSDGTYVKIGTSSNPSRRLATLQTASSRELKVLGVIPGGEEFEHSIHKLYAAKRVHGEWFSLSVQDVEDIKRMHPDAATAEKPITLEPVPSASEVLGRETLCTVGDACPDHLKATISSSIRSNSMLGLFTLAVVQRIQAYDKRSSYLDQIRADLEAVHGVLDITQISHDVQEVLDETGESWYSSRLLAVAVEKSLKTALTKGWIRGHGNAV